MPAQLPSVSRPASDTLPEQPAGKLTVHELSQDTVDEPATQLLATLPIVRRRATPAPVEVAVGQQLGPYKLLKQLGRGPKGIVFAAEDTLLGRAAAVKVLAPEMAARGTAWCERFLQEARLASRIDHPLFLGLYGVGQESGLTYCAMPLMKGSARERLKADGPFRSIEATRIVRQVAQALVAAHGRGACHGNLKPSNIFLDDASVKIADFAVPHGPAEPASGCSPRPQDVMTDLRLLGATYHWLLTGRPPADYGAAIGANVPKACARVIAAALARRRGYASAEEMVDALAETEEILADGPRSAERIVIPAPAATSRSPRRPEVGQLLGKCMLTQRVGIGSAGVVYSAWHQSLNIPVAVKLLHTAGDSTVYRQLRSEARLMAQLNHANIVRVWDFEDDPELPYLVLEYVEGPSLSDVLRQHGRMSAERAVRVITQIADGLAAAKRLGIVHRDVKPANILLTADGTAKLADLGLAMLMNQDHGHVARGLAGTVAYMPPEQASTEGSVDHRSDIYALGATFYHLVTGQLPFQGATRLEVIIKHSQEAPLPPHQLIPDLPPALSGVVLKMLAKAPHDRYQTYDELLADLAGLDEMLSGPPSLRRWPHRCRT